MSFFVFFFFCGNHESLHLPLSTNVMFTVMVNIKLPRFDTKCLGSAFDVLKSLIESPTQKQKNDDGNDNKRLNYYKENCITRVNTLNSSKCSALLSKLNLTA